MKFGWLNTTIISMSIGVLSLLSYILLSLLVDTASDIVTSVIIPLMLFIRVYFDVLILCFVADQLIEQSCKSDHFSSFAWWFAWSTNLGTLITEISTCFFKDSKNYEICASSAHLASLIIIIMSALFIRRWTTRYDFSENPLKLILNVLRFAVKNKHPLNRSALTYWEEAPSRINFGKTKYGGPFLEKDVESVKTFFRLIPLIAVVVMIFFPYQILGRFTENMSLKNCLLFGAYTVEYAVVIATVPIYQFIIKRYCFTQIRMSILRRTGIGIALMVLGKLGYVILELSRSIPVYVNYNKTLCLLQSTPNVTISHDLISNESYLYYYMIPKCINSLGFLLTIVGSFEFVFAQAPHSMRGLLLGLWFSIGGIYEIAGWTMIKPFKAVGEYLVPSCELYILIMNFLFMLLSLILFTILSKWYKFHSHEDVFNAHHIAEAHYENEFNRRDQHNDYGSISFSLSN